MKNEPTKRLSSEERKLSIVLAAMPLFAQKGFHGSTTKELAAAAGVSESLLYKHFPSKESLYNEIEQSCCQGGMQKAQQVAELEASTSTLVMGIYLIVFNIVKGTDDPEVHQNIMRMMIHSLTEDGEFARLLIKNKMEQWLPKFNECFEAAWNEGSLNQEPTDPDQLVWFCHHIAVSLAIFSLPKPTAISYKKTLEQLIDEATLFVLRGISLKEEVIKQVYQPKNFKIMLTQ